MHAIDDSPIAVNFVSFATSNNAMVEYFYNCPTDDKQLTSIQTKELTAKCKYVVTVENAYNTFYRISDFNALQPDGMLRFQLIIRGDSDAHILFAAKKYFEWDIAYEIGMLMRCGDCVMWDARMRGAVCCGAAAVISILLN